MIIKAVDGRDIEIQKLIRWMDAEVFPDDKPVTFNGSKWFIGYEYTYDTQLNATEEAVCYAAWRPHYPMYRTGELHWNTPLGFLYRAGVLPKAQGKGYQKELIKVREVDMLEAGITKSITYTETYSIASMKSMIAMGYKPYLPGINTNLAGEGRAPKFVHWEKSLV